MSKQLYSQRFILKIHSNRIRMNDWSLNINLKEARLNEELISLGDSQILRFIRDIRNINYTEKEIYEVKKQIKVLKKNKDDNKNKSKIKELYNKLDNMLFIEDYLTIVFDKKSDFDRMCSRKGFKINGKRFVRIMGTTGGVKQNAVNFCSEEIHKELNKRLENGRNKNIEMIPAKFEAYKSLSASVSTPVTQTDRILVIHDGVTHIKDKVIRVYDDTEGGFKVDKNVEYEADKEFADGCCMIRKEFAEQWAIDLGLTRTLSDGKVVADYIPSGFNTRFSYEKGMLFTFPFEEFGEKIAKNYMVTDVWGKEKDIRKIDIIMTTNMLKLWSAYTSIEDYLNNCKENGYKLSVTKVCQKALEEKRNMNYQYLQSYELNDEDINELVEETVTNIKGAIGDDYIKSILFTKGVHITDKNINESDFDYIRALMIDKRMVNDPYVKNKIYRLIEKKIKEAKKGILQVNGNYSIVAGDLYALCESMFGMEIKGLLKYGEFYSQTWLDKGVNEIVAFRSPMTSHNNIKKMKLIDNDKIRHWYRYMSTVTVLNAWDTTTDAENGMDFDSDAIITTNNPVLLRSTRNELPIICEQKSAPKVKVSESLLRKSNKNGFGDDIGTITNRVTAMFDVLASLDKGSEEYNELMDRIICGQAYQQESIDKIKGIEAKEMPKSWFSYKHNKINEEDSEQIKKEKEKNIRLMVNKKPYFFIYNYNLLNKKYNKFKRDTNNNCLIRFGKTLRQLEQYQETDQERNFIKAIKYKSPVFNNPCTMNKICWKIEEEFKDIKLKINKNDKFDNSIIKTNKRYSKKTSDEIKELYKEYRKKQSENLKYKNQNVTSEENANARNVFVYEFKLRAEEICSNSEDLCNILIDMLYKSKDSKQFVWDVCGEQIIENLLNKNDRKYKYPVTCKGGDVEWQGLTFKMIEKEVK